MKTFREPLEAMRPGLLMLGHDGRWYQVDTVTRLTAGWVSVATRDIETGKRYEIRGDSTEHRTITTRSHLDHHLNGGG